MPHEMREEQHRFIPFYRARFDTLLQGPTISFPFYWLYPILEVNGGAVRGMGKTLPSMITVILNMCVLRVALLAIFSRVFRTIESLGSCYPITWATASISFLILFHFIVRKKIREHEPEGARA